MHTSGGCSISSLVGTWLLFFPLPLPLPSPACLPTPSPSHSPRPLARHFVSHSSSRQPGLLLVNCSHSAGIPTSRIVISISITRTNSDQWPIGPANSPSKPARPHAATPTHTIPSDPQSPASSLSSPSRPHHRSSFTPGCCPTRPWPSASTPTRPNRPVRLGLCSLSSTAHPTSLPSSHADQVPLWSSFSPWSHQWPWPYT